MFPEADLKKYSRQEALKTLLQRFAYRHVAFDRPMAKSFFKLPEKEISTAVAALCGEGILIETGHGYILRGDAALLDAHAGGQQKQVFVQKQVFAMHRNDFLVKSNEHWLKEKYTHGYPDTLYYLLIDGEFRGAVIGKFRYTPEVEDIMLDLPGEEACARKTEILQAVRVLCGAKSPVRRYRGKELE
jgi:hypothetical protein